MSGKGNDNERPVVILPVDNIRQETGKWCWLAVSEQIIRWKQGTSPTQAQLAEWVIGNDPRLWERGGRLEEIATLIRHWGLASTTIELPSDPLGVYAWLAKSSPVILAVDTSPETAHVVVLRGMVWQGDEALFIINDPLLRPGYSLAVTWRQLRRTWKASVVVL